MNEEIKEETCEKCSGRGSYRDRVTHIVRTCPCQLIFDSKFNGILSEIERALDHSHEQDAD